MTVHFIAQLTVHDPERYLQYEKGFFPILKAHGGRFLTFDDDATVLDGERTEQRTVLIEFETEEACRTWWDSPEYREIAAHREAASTTHCIQIVHPLPGR